MHVVPYYACYVLCLGCVLFGHGNRRRTGGILDVIVVFLTLNDVIVVVRRLRHCGTEFDYLAYGAVQPPTWLSVMLDGGLRTMT